MSNVVLNWDADGAIDSYEVYRSLSPIDTDNLPPPLAIDITEKTYTDNTIEPSQTYYYVVSSVVGTTKKFSENVQVATVSLDTGVWVSSFSENPASTFGNSFKLTGTQDAAWIENFGKTSGFAVSGYTNAGSVDQLGVINKQVSGLNFEIYSRISYNTADSIQFMLEFKNSSGVTIFALELFVSGAFSVGIKYGANASSLTTNGTNGSYPYVYGNLVFSNSGVTFTPKNTSGFSNPFSFAFDAASVRSISVTKNRARRYFADDSYQLYSYMKCVS